MSPVTSDDAIRFEDLGLRSELVDVLSSLGYEEPTPVQQQTIPPLLQGRDLLGQAATGTGKTAAFALPILDRLADKERSREPMALVLVPTRELAIQVSEAMHRYGRGVDARVLPIYGGQPISRQRKGLARGVDVVVATPGRALDHLARGTLVLQRVDIVVLDEADEMLDMGFVEDIESILLDTPANRQLMLFSATMPGRIDALARRYLRDPVRITVDREQLAPGEAPRIRQTAYVVPAAHKPAALGRVLDIEAPAAAIVFCRTRVEVEELTAKLNARGYRAEALHGGMSQDQRDRVMDRLRSETSDLLVATDVAARGLDIEHLSHVVNYDVPSAPERYVHRIGRVGRAGREGVAITLIEPRQQRLLRSIERHTGQKLPIEKVPTVADLRTRRLELTRAALRENLVDDTDLDGFRSVVETLTDEFDILEVALAAVKLAHDAGDGRLDEEELPEVSLRAEGGRAARGRGPAPGHQRGRRGDIDRLFIGAGRRAGVRPKDLVGAIANESSLDGRDIGAVHITENFSLVEVPSSAADEVIAALRNSTIKGRKAVVRRDKRS